MFLPPAVAVMAAVTELSGRAWVRQPDGSLLELRPGTTIPSDSEIITASGATVTLAIDGAAPITIGENRSVAITDDLGTPADPAQAVVTAPGMTDAERLLAALDSSDDPFGILEATAAIAGGPGGDDGGGSFVRLMRIVETTRPLDAPATSRTDRTGQADLPRLSGGVAIGADTGVGGDIGPVPNTPPVSRDVLRHLLEASVYTFARSDFAFADPADGDAMQAIRITTLPAKGTLRLGDEAVTAGMAVSVQDLQDGKLTYQASDEPGRNIEFPFNFQVIDTGGTSNGGSNTSDPHHFTLTVRGQFILATDYANIYGKNGNDVILGGVSGASPGAVSGEFQQEIRASQGYNISDTIGSTKIIFGDVINTDNLPWGMDGNPSKPDGDPGLDALKYFLAAPSQLGHPPTDAELHAWITQHHALLNTEDDSPWGDDDFIEGGMYSNIIYAGPGDDYVTGGFGDNVIYGGAGNDLLVGSGKNNWLYGGSGNDQLHGHGENNWLYGGKGDDYLLTTGGNTMLVWLKGDAGTVDAPARDQVAGFDQFLPNTYPINKDTLDLRDLLIDEETHSDLSQYLNITFDGADTVINVSTTGVLHADGSGFGQVITLLNVDVTDGVTDQKQLIENLIQAGKLLIDQ